MQPIKLEMQNFITFAGTHTIDFTQLQQDSLFLIMGETGAGKTSIFDAIFFALYGESTNKERAASTLRSHFASDDEETKVIFTFSLRGVEYTVERNPTYTRSAKRGTGQTEEKHKAVFHRPGQKPLEGPKAVDAEITALLGLDANQFKQLVMIPQNEFRKLISSDSNEREIIFTQLFNTQIYTRIVDSVNREKNALNGELTTKKAIVNESLKKIFAVQDVWLQQQLVDIEYNDARVIPISQQASNLLEEEFGKNKEELGHKNTMIAMVVSKLEVLKQFTLIQEQKEASLKDVMLLDAQKDEMDKLNASNVHNQEVVKLYQFFQSLQEKQRELSNTSNQLVTIENHLQQKQADLKSIQESIKAEEGNWAKIPSLTGELNEKQKKVEDWDNYLEAKSFYETHEARLVAKLQKQCEELISASLEQADKRSALSRKQSEHDSLLADYQHNIAGVLAKELQPQKECPVCGSLDHPHVAQFSGKEITKEDLEQKKSEVEQANDDLLKATTTLEGKRNVWIELVQFPSMPVQLGSIDWENPIEGLKSNLGALESFDTHGETAVLFSKQELESAKNALSTYQGMDQLNITQLKSDVESLNNEIKGLTDQQKQLLDEQNNLNIDIGKLEGGKETTTKLVDKYEIDLKQLQEQYDIMLSASTVQPSEVENCIIDQTVLDQSIEKYSSYQSELIVKTALYETKSRELGEFIEQNPKADKLEDVQLSEENTQLLSDIKSLQDRQNKVFSLIGQLGQELGNLSKEKEKLEKLETLYSEISDINELVSNKQLGFKSYVLSVYFDEILEAANIRFAHMTNQRYTMRRDAINARENQNSALNLVVHDAYNEKDRDIKTLSGGESFKAALALALAMGDVVRGNAGGIEINTLFIDEGFGTLDPDSLDSALEVLLQLKDAGRMVGVISHVSELKNRINTKVEIEKSSSGSTIRMYT